MNKYKVYFEQTLTGYIEVFADNEDHAISRLRKEPPLRGQLVIETDDIDFITSVYSGKVKIPKLNQMKEVNA